MIIEDMELDIAFPEHPDEVAIDSDRDVLYLLEQNFCFDLVRKEWRYEELLP